MKSKQIWVVIVSGRYEKYYLLKLTQVETVIREGAHYSGQLSIFSKIVGGSRR